MKYIIIPANKFEEVDKVLAKKLGLDKPRRSIDGTEVIMHIESYQRLFANIPTAFNTQNTESYPIYDHQNEDFISLMQSDKWTISEEEL